MQHRIIIIGTSCSGKSTLAKHLKKKLGIPHIEMDHLYWAPDWRPVPLEDFQQKVAMSVKSESWIVNGNYSAVRDFIWPKATHVIWLDFPFYVVFGRAIKRVIRHLFHKTSFCNGNYETFSRVFLSKDSILLWVIMTYWRRKRSFMALLKKPEYRPLKVIHLRSPKELKIYFEVK
jgi:adenylate kinase family enzyme